MKLKIFLDYVKFCNLTFIEKEKVLSWYSENIGVDIIDLNILNFFNLNLKRKLSLGDIHVLKSKNNTYNIAIAGRSCRGLLENLSALVKEINVNSLVRLDVKIIEDCNMSMDEIDQQHRFLKNKGESIWTIVNSQSGITSYTGFFGGRVRVYNYYDSSETSFELQFDKKKGLILIRDYLVNGKVENFKIF